MRWAHCDNRHPSPYWDDDLERIFSYEHCAFTSLAALNEWFEHEWRVLLFAHGFKVYEYEVPGARIGGCGQAIIRRDTARLVGVTDLTD
jgi:hypothetical protein